MEQGLLEQILHISRRMAQTRSLMPLLNNVVDEAIKLVGAERGYVVLTKPDGSWNFQIQRHLPGKAVDHAEEEVSKSVLDQVVQSGQPALLKDAMHDPRFGKADSVIFLGLRSIVCVPMITRGETIGAIYVENRSVKNCFQEQDQSALQLFANQVAVSIENAALNEDLEARVTQRTKELNAAKIHLERSWSEAVEANRLKTVWLGNVAHDVSSPLTVVSGALSLLKKGTLGELNEAQQEWVGKALRAIKHTNSLINDLLSFSKIDAGSLTLDRQYFSLEAILDNVFDMAQGLPWSEDVTLHLKAPPMLPMVFVDPLRINQVLLNLMDNAHKFTISGNVTLEAFYSPGDNRIELSVTDTGIGIAPDKLDCLFERFQQVDDNPQRRRQGSGLGLAICRELVELHDGHIWVESTLGIGSSFRFTLPVT